MLHVRRIPFVPKIRRMDWIGIILFMVSTTSLLFGVTVGGTLYQWTSFRTLLPLVLGVVGLFVFVIVEAYLPTEPMVSLKIFCSRTAASAYIGTFLHGMVVLVHGFADRHRPHGISPSI